VVLAQQMLPQIRAFPPQHPVVQVVPALGQQVGVELQQGQDLTRGVVLELALEQVPALALALARLRTRAQPHPPWVVDL
jgi:hypothetical protein